MPGDCFVHQKGHSRTQNNAPASPGPAGPGARGRALRQQLYGGGILASRTRRRSPPGAQSQGRQRPGRRGAGQARQDGVWEDRQGRLGGSAAANWIANARGRRPRTGHTSAARTLPPRPRATWEAAGRAATPTEGCPSRSGVSLMRRRWSVARGTPLPGAGVGSQQEKCV